MLLIKRCITFFGHEAPCAEEQVKWAIGLVDGRHSLEEANKLSLDVPRQEDLLGGHSMQPGTLNYQLQVAEPIACLQYHLAITKEESLFTEHC